jgi:hypothetical protein
MGLSIARILPYEKDPARQIKSNTEEIVGAAHDSVDLEMILS